MISAASIIAKVYRDNLMIKLSEEFSDYAWESNFGYGTKAHLDGLKNLVLPLIIVKVLNLYTRYCLTRISNTRGPIFSSKTFDPGFNLELNLKMLKFSNQIVNGDCLKEIKKFLISLLI